jgi:hypothetical protein
LNRSLNDHIDAFRMRSGANSLYLSKQIISMGDAAQVCQYGADVIDPPCHSKPQQIIIWFSA